MTALPTGRGLLIAEKDSAKQDFEKCYRRHSNELPYQLDFQKFHGHVTELKMPAEINPKWEHWSLDNLPMVPDKWEYKPEQNRKRYDDVLNTIAKGNYDFIIDGGDFEREGQLIQDAFFSTMPAELQKIPVYRIWANDMTDASLLKGYQNLLLPEDHIPGGGTVQALSDASFIRARFDWLLGLNSTQALSLRSNAKISVGRVKLPILNIVAKRENEITNFVPRKFWTINAEFTTPAGEKYVGTLLNQEDHQPYQFDTEAAAQQVINMLNGQAGTITSVTKKKVNENPPKLFDTGSIQGKAGELYGYPATQTDEVLEKLYQMKITTYPRVDVDVITTEVAAEIDLILKNIAKIDKLEPYTHPTAEQIARFQKSKRYVNNKRVKAHTGLVMTNGLDKSAQPWQFDTLTDDQQDILFLIARSICVALMDPIVKNKTEIITTVGDYQFKTNGSQMVDPGWSTAVAEYKNKDTVVPDVAEGDAVTLGTCENKAGQTQPPKRYNQNTLINFLKNINRVIDDEDEKNAMKEAEGLGRPSTRSTIIQTLIDNKMMQRKGKKMEYSPTKFGLSIIQNLSGNELIDPELTAHWEKRLQDVEAGDIQADDLYQQMVAYTEKVINKLKEQDLHITDIPAGQKSKGTTSVGQLTNGNDVFEGKSGFFDNDFKAYLDAVQAAKKAGQPTPERQGFWISKKINSPKIKMKGSFSAKDVQQFLAGKTVEKEFCFPEHSQQYMKRAVQYDFDNGRIAFKKSATNVAQREQLEIAGVQLTHIAGKNAQGKSFDFYAVDSDKNKLPNIPAVIAQHRVTNSDLESLLINHQFQADDFVSKKGKAFAATVTLKNNKWSFNFPSNDGNLIDETNGCQIYQKNITTKVGRKMTLYTVKGAQSFQVWGNISQHQVTLDDLHELINRGFFFAADFVSRKGSLFSAEYHTNGKFNFR